MKADKKSIIEAILKLVTSLEKTKNPTIPFFKEAISRIESCDSENELKKILYDYSIVGPGKIADFGGFNREQCNLSSDMHKIAYKTYQEL